MSAAASSANKANVYNEESEALYDAYAGFAVPSLYTEIQWPEWSDADLNAESWDEGKGRATTAVGVKKDSSASQVSCFNDSDPTYLPLSISASVFTWKRPQDVFVNAVLTVYDPSNTKFELTVPRTADCSFFKSFNEQLRILQYYAVSYGFPVELETPKFTANTQGETWRPWHHVYGMCKAGKGQVHRPLYCPYGKYVVRLFYMGMWRRVVVDDKIPCDVFGECMLPTSQCPGELWPIILSKALLKILRLTPTSDFTATDFPLISFFTGWAQGGFTASNKTADQLWRRLTALLPSYELPKDPGEVEEKSGAPSKKESKKESRPSLEKKESQAEKFCFLLAELEGFPLEEKLSDEYAVGVTMVRDRPLEKVNKRASTKPWKRIRWVHWAKGKGLWTDELLMPPYRRVQNIAFARELTELLAPDPKQESVLYEVPTGDETTEEELTSCEENVEPEQWCDFLKFKNHIRRMKVFFKPSAFAGSFKVTCLKEMAPEGAASGKSTGKGPPPPQNFFYYPPVMKPTFNEPLFLFCESSTGIFLCISLWVSPKGVKGLHGYLDGKQPEVLKVGHGSLVVEEFHWRRLQEGKILGVVKTVGNSTLSLSLKPGRHILKLWLSTDSPYVIDVHSNASTVVHKNSRIRLLMTSESETISNYVANVSNAFIALTLKFGKPDLGPALRDFYNAIRPGNDGAINYRAQIDDFIETFLNCILLSLKDAIPSTDELKIMMWALQSLFFNPNIRCDLPPGEPSSSIYGATKAHVKKVVSVTEQSALSEVVDYPWSCKEIGRIVLIQRIFRGYRVRLLWKYQSAARKEFKAYSERLKKICDALFAPAKREQEVGMLLRRVVMAKPNLLTAFRFHEDLSNVVQLEEYSGRVANVESGAWVPLFRFVIGCHSEDPVPCAFHLSCNLEDFLIQGFDNDTNQEIFRLSRNVSPHYYKSNVRGYTIFAFGWNEANPRTVHWKLELMRMKHFQGVHMCNMLLDYTCHPYTIPSLDVIELRNFYIPNSKSRVCRCFIKIQKRSLLTFRFTASYCEVHFVVTISLEKNFYSPSSEMSVTDTTVILKSSSSSGTIMVPSVVLELVENPNSEDSYSDSEATVYVVEVFVLNNSWPLTKQEWGVVEPLRVNGESWKDSRTSLQSKKGGSDSRKKLTRMSKRAVSEQKTVENPCWMMQVVHDTGGADGGDISVEEDKSYMESVKSMKLLWEERDPGRRKRGREMRMEFLWKTLAEKRNALDEEGGEAGGFGDEVDVGAEMQSLLERISSFSYLTNDPSPTRYVFSPRTLPPVPLFELLCKYCKVSKTVTYASESSDFCDLSENLPHTSKSPCEEVEEDTRDFLNQSVHYRSVMVNHTSEEQKLSTQLMEQAYEGRLKAIERMMR